jgi:hypothetical protein
MVDADVVEPNLADRLRSVVADAMSDEIALVGEFVVVAQTVRHDGSVTTWVLATEALAPEDAQAYLRRAADLLDV